MEGAKGIQPRCFPVKNCLCLEGEGENSVKIGGALLVAAEGAGEGHREGRRGSKTSV